MQKTYKLGEYCRYSKDDGSGNESSSIATQKAMLTEYAEKQGWRVVKTYVDARLV